jgi:hypothetical protein
VVDPKGGQDYVNALNQAVQKRTNVGKALVNTGKVSGDQSDLEAGRADPRLLAILHALVGAERIDVVGLTDSGPSASAGVPYRVMYLATKDPLGKIVAAAYLKVIQNLLQAHATFPAAGVTPAMVNGQKVIQISYPAPSPN